MPCEEYQDALTDLAAKGAEPAGEVRAHLGVCASCRSYLTLEKLLFASIDSAVRSNINEPLPAALVQRLHARVAQESTLRRNWSPILAATAIAIAATIVVGIVTVQYRFHQTRPQAGVRGTIAVAATVANTDSAFSAPSSGPSTSSRGRSSPGVTLSHVVGSAKQSRLEVIVPSDQQVLLAQYARMLQSRALDARMRPVSLPAASAIEPIVMAANVISELKVQPLPDLQSQ
jgi:hypothetical protein